MSCFTRKKVTMTGSRIVLYSLLVISHLTARTFLIDTDEDDGKKPCICPLLLLPVCGVNGQTYDNDCIARCDDIRQESLRSQSMYKKLYFLR